MLTAWTVNGEGTLSLGAGECEVVDSFGGRKKVPGKSIAVGEFPIYIHGAGDWPEVAARVAAAKEALAKQAAADQKLASLRALLFDFGPADQEVGILQGFGPPRNFSAVTGETAYSSGSGFGFEKVPVLCQEKKWIRDLLDRDSCRMDKSNAFVFDAPPGKYAFTLSAAPVAAGTQSRISLEGATKTDGSAAVFVVGEKTSPQSAEIIVASEKVRVTTDNPADLRWMSLIESHPSGKPNP